jgi:hypothetical protein
MFVRVGLVLLRWIEWQGCQVSINHAKWLLEIYAPALARAEGAGKPQSQTKEDRTMKKTILALMFSGLLGPSVANAQAPGNAPAGNAPAPGGNASDPNSGTAGGSDRDTKNNQRDHGAPSNRTNTRDDTVVSPVNSGAGGSGGEPTAKTSGHHRDKGAGGSNGASRTR